MAEGPVIEFDTTDETYLKDLVERSFLMMIEEKEEEKEKKKEKQTEKPTEKKNMITNLFRLRRPMGRARPTQLTCLNQDKVQKSGP